MKICIICNERPTPKTGKKKDGSPKYSSYCTKCKRAKYKDRIWVQKFTSGYKNQQWKGDLCERCGFVPEDPCQLDIDHIQRIDEDGQDVIDNTQTLCANCHRLKTTCETRGIPLPPLPMT